jgi:hypothetical protein
LWGGALPRDGENKNGEKFEGEKVKRKTNNEKKNKNEAVGEAGVLELVC